MIFLFSSISGGIAIRWSLNHWGWQSCAGWKSRWCASSHCFIVRLWASWALAISRPRSWGSWSGSRSVWQMNISSGSRVRLLLSCSPLSSVGGLESMSAAVWSLPGMCLIVRLYSCSSPNHQATLRFTFLGVFQYVRLAWSVSTVTGVSVAAMWGLQ